MQGMNMGNVQSEDNKKWQIRRGLCRNAPPGAEDKENVLQEREKALQAERL